MFGPLRDLNSSLDPGGRRHEPSTEVTRLGATDLSAEVSGRAQQDILGGVHIAGTSAPEYMAPSSAPCILAPSMHLKRAPVPHVSIHRGLRLVDRCGAASHGLTEQAEEREGEASESIRIHLDHVVVAAYCRLC